MRSLLSILFILSLSFTFSQVESPYIQNFTNKIYGKNSNPEIYSVVQDKQNVIIAGTSNGVLIYNASTWKFVGVKEGAHVISLCKNEKGSIFLGAVGDFGELKKNKQGKYYFHSYCKKEKINETVWRVHTLKDKVLFQTESTIYVYKNGKLEQKISATTSFHLSFVSNEKFYVRQRGKGLYSYENESLKLIESSEKMKNEGLFALFDKNNKKKYFFRNDFSQDPLESSIYGGIELQDGNFAVNTLTSGIYILDKNFKIKFHYSQNQGLTDNDVKQIYQGSDGNLWLATNNGLSCIEYQSNLSFYSQKQALEGDVYDVILSKNKRSTYIATSKGVYLKTSEGIEKLNISFPSWEFFQDKSKIYVASSGGIFQVEGKNVKLLKSGTYNNICYFQGNFILSGQSGIEVCNNEFSTVKKYDLALNRSLKMLLDNKRNELWIGTIGAGLYRLKSDFSLEIYDNQIDGLNIAWIKPLKNFKGKIVFATKDGLQQFIYEEEIRKSLPDSLKYNPDYCRGVFEAMSASSDEISEMFSFQNLKYVLVQNELKIQKFKTFRNSAYTLIDFGRINAVKKLGDGNIYLLTSEGLVVIDKNASSYKSNFILNFEEINSKEKSLDLTENEAIPYKFNELYINLHAPLFFHSSLVKFRYKMNDEQEFWSEYNDNSSIHFSKLTEGDYTILIQAKNSFGQESSIISYSFSILPPWYRTIWAYLFYVFILIFSFWFAIKVSKQRLQRKNEELEQIVQERTHEIALQKEEIEEKHKEITDSINYAERIQTALMMSDEHWEALTKDYFILFKPRDVVSGDFYWAYQNEKYAIWVAADCTGHGVPGAFMSMLGIGFLNEIVIEGKNVEPATILNLLRSKIIKSLEQKGSTEERKDGMDISLCCWDKKSGTIKFAGANNPLILITKNEEKAQSFEDDKMISLDGKFLVTISADKMPVGKYVNDEKPFSQKEFALDEDDFIFSFSDGFPDQFGGSDGKKYMIKRLKTFLISQQNIGISDFKNLLENEFSAWMKEGDSEQIDDVCIVGVQLK